MSNSSRQPEAAGTYVAPPPRPPFLLRFLLGLVEGRLGHPLVANRLLMHYPKAFWGSGLLEALVAHHDREVPRRLLKLIRMQVSFAASCPFCIDMNSQEFAGEGIVDDEILALRDLKSLDEVPTFSPTERAALRYARAITRTPLSFDPGEMAELKRLLSDRAIVIVASTAAQVNFWARLIQSLGVMPAGFSTECSILELGAYSTRRGRPVPDFAASESLLRTLIETIPIPVFYKDCGGRYIDANRSFIDNFAPSRDGLIGRTVFDLYPPELAPIYAEKDEELFRSGGTQVYDARMLDMANRMRDVRFHKAAFLDGKGKVAGLVGAIFDVTEMKAAEARLARAASTFRTIYQSAADPILVVALDGAIVDANPAACEILGYTLGELRRLRTVDLNSGSYESEVPARFEALRRTGSIEFETENHTKDGRILAFEIHSRVVEIDGEDRILSVYRDITRRREADREVRGRLKEKELVLREVHHRIKNNMSVISSLLGLQASMASSEEARDILHHATGRVDSMMVLYDRLYRSDDVGSLPLRDYLPGLVDEIIAIFPHAIPVRVETDIDDTALGARLLSPLGIIVNELVTNTMKYAWRGREEGTIRISAGRRADRVFVDYADDGVGIPEAAAAPAGGFGLQLIEMLAAQMKADFRIGSAEKGGTTATLEFEA